jgi:hypothetical protein
MTAAEHGEDNDQEPGRCAHCDRRADHDFRRRDAPRCDAVWLGRGTPPADDTLAMREVQATWSAGVTSLGPFCRRCHDHLAPGLRRSITRTRQGVPA